jgi:hypothetical protein
MQSTQVLKLGGCWFVCSADSDGHPCNHLELGPLADCILNYCTIMSMNPGVPLEHDPTTFDKLPSTFDGSPWPSPKVFNAVEALIVQLPHLERAPGRVFALAREEWIIFLIDDKKGGLIDSLTPALCTQYYVLATSDHVEGTGGDYKEAQSRAPGISQSGYNARRLWWKDPLGRQYMQALWKPQQYCMARAKAHQIVNSGKEKKQRTGPLLQQIKATEVKLQRLRALSAKTYTFDGATTAGNETWYSFQALDQDHVTHFVDAVKVLDVLHTGTWVGKNAHWEHFAC